MCHFQVVWGLELFGEVHLQSGAVGPAYLHKQSCTILNMRNLSGAVAQAELRNPKSCAILGIVQAKFRNPSCAIRPKSCAILVAQSGEVAESDFVLPHLTYKGSLRIYRSLGPDALKSFGFLNPKIIPNPFICFRFRSPGCFPPSSPRTISSFVLGIGSSGSGASSSDSSPAARRAAFAAVAARSNTSMAVARSLDVAMLEGFLDFDFGVLEGSDFLDTLELSSLVLLDSFELSANVEFLEALELFFLRNVVAGRSMVAALESALASRVFSFPAEHVSGPADAT